VRDVGGAPVALADAQEQRLVVGPKLIVCGNALSKTGGHTGKSTMCVNRIATIIGLDRSAASQTVQRKYARL
jgi:hypothetical protein